MVKEMFRSRSVKKKKVRIPGNKVVIHFKKKKVSAAKCGVCKKPLNGVPRLRQSEIRKLAKTKRRPERPFGGNLCSKCMKKVFRERAINV